MPTFGLGLAGRIADTHVAKPIRDNKGLATLLFLVTFAVGLAILVGKLCRRFWRTSITAACIGYMVVLGGWWAPAQLAGILALALVVWRVWRPDSFRRHVVPGVCGWWARWFRYGYRWKVLAHRHGLEVHDSQAVRLMHGRGGDQLAYAPTEVTRAKLKRVVWTPATDRLLVKLPWGLAPADVERIADSFAHATKSLACRVRPHKPGSVWIELLRRDPLTATIPALPIPDEPTIGPVAVGRREDGELWRLGIFGGRHTLVVGCTGSGKSGVEWGILRGLAPAIANGQIEVYGFDPKGGLELRMGPALFTRLYCDDIEAMVDGLEECVRDMQAQTKALSGDVRSHQPTLERPFRLIIIDELLALVAFCDAKLRRRVDAAIGMLLTQGRAPGYAVVAFVQDARKELVQYRNLFPVRVALRLTEAAEVDMVLGDGARNRGALADLISDQTAGVAYVRQDNQPDPIRVRAAYVTDADIRAMAQNYAAGSRLPEVRALLAGPKGEVDPVNLRKDNA